MPSAVVSTVQLVPDPEDEVATAVPEVNPPTPLDSDPRLSVLTPPRLGLVIVIVSPIR